MRAQKAKFNRQTRRSHGPWRSSGTPDAVGAGTFETHGSLLLLVLMAATLVAYSPAWHGTMLWDDDFHITPPALRSLAGLGRIWFTIGATPQYYPLVHSAFWLQHWLWGDDPFGYHLVNIVLHALSAFFVAVILRRLQVRGAILAALIFALHPVHVESVAWMTELKNTLSGVFYLASALAYLDFDTTRRSRSYWLAFVLFAMALLSKSVTATLPAALLVVFWWQRGVIAWRRDALPLTPFFAIGVASGLVTAWFERALIGAEGAAFNFTVVERCLVAGRVVWFYLAKLLWPAHLTFIYPRWNISQRIWWEYLCPLGVLGLVGGLWIGRAHARAPLAAVLFFIGTLFPALGFLNVYPFQFSFVADHFQYLASIGIIALGSAGLTMLADRWRIDRRARHATAIALVAVLGVLTWNQSRLYADAFTLYRATIDRNPGAWLAHNNLGELELGTPDGLPDAMAEFREALRVHPTYPLAHNNLGVALLRSGRADEAIAEFRQALVTKPTDVSARMNLALALAQRGRFDEAATQYQDVLTMKPDAAVAQANLGVALEQLGRPAEAETHLREAVRLQPNEAGYHDALGGVLHALQQDDAAVAEYRAALALGPGTDAVNIHNDLGLVLGTLRRYDEASAEFREALRLDPASADARANLARAVAAMGAASPTRPSGR